MAISKQEYGQKRKEIAAINHRMKCYGLSEEDYSGLLATQNGVCVICDCSLNGKACIDHNHLTGRVRGLLCVKCNTMLGMAGDSVETLENAIKYLKSEAE